MIDAKSIHTSSSFRCAAAVLTAILALAPVRAHAASKEIIALQTQVQQLLDMVQRMQSTLDTRFGVLQHLVEQTADNANQMTQTVNALQQKINQQNDALSGKIDTASGQVQSLNDSVDELKSRIAKLDKSISGSPEPVAEHPVRPRRDAQPGAAPTGAPLPTALALPAVGNSRPAINVPPPQAPHSAAAQRNLSGWPARLQRRQVHRRHRRISGRGSLLPDG